ncbi:pre-mRNA-splicing factor SYF1-like [Salvia divinorum]|uniref:Pre-mRNA-splicing factor SYF1-like n=1 Tax=Salvia divinorum TaxID=28513 RepID=A0ABD1HTZ0_SALDI
MAICEDVDYPFEEEVFRNPHNLKSWWRYLTHAPRAIIYARALKALPGSYKLWHAYLRLRLDAAHGLPITDSQHQTLNNTFERALAMMHKMSRIWLMFLQSLNHKRLITRTRRTFDRALRALPVTQHASVWECYIAFASQKSVPLKTSLVVYNRFLKYDPSYIEDYIEFLIDLGLWKMVAERLAEVLRVMTNLSLRRGRLIIECGWNCDLLIQHSSEMSSGLDVDAIIRGGIRKFRDEVGRLWTCLVDYYIRRGLLEKARDVYEEGMTTVITVRDFGEVFDAYSQFEESVLSIKIKNMDNDDIDEEGFWFKDENDVDMLLERYEHLIHRSSELANCVQMRQNPHNVNRWHQRVKLFQGNPTKQILTYTEAVRTVDPIKAVGKPHTLWVGFANLYKAHGDVSNARMELRHNNFKGALQLIQRATYEPSVEVKKRVTAQGVEPVQMKLYKYLKLWTFYADLEESFGTLESTCAVYERIINLRLATPQIILNYEMLLQISSNPLIYFEDSFKVYERGVEIFKYPHVKDIWVAYLSTFVKRYGKSKLERAREMFEMAIEKAPAESVKPLYLYLEYAKMEEEYGMAKRVMRVYDEATRAVPPSEKLGVYKIYIARAAAAFGLAKTREIYEQAINESGLSDKDVKAMCLRYAQVEKQLGEIDRGRAMYKHASQFADPRCVHEYLWNKWHEFEVQHGSEDTYLEMHRIKRSVRARYCQSLDKAKEGDDKMERRLTSNDIDSSGRGGLVQHNEEDVELPPQEDEEIQQGDAIFGGLNLVRKRDERSDAQNDGAMERIKRMRQSIDSDHINYADAFFEDLDAFGWKNKSVVSFV